MTAKLVSWDLRAKRKLFGIYWEQRSALQLRRRGRRSGDFLSHASSSTASACQAAFWQVPFARVPRARRQLFRSWPTASTTVLALSRRWLTCQD